VNRNIVSLIIQKDLPHVYSLPTLMFMKKSEMDGYIGQSIGNTSPSTILSKFLGKQVHLVYKGPVPRPCNPTFAFPQLQSTIAYQDGYPMLFLSEETVEEVERQVRNYVGVQGVEERWRDDRLVIERQAFNSGVSL
jgi:hypothetical protein